LTPGRRDVWRCEVCRKYAIVKFNGRPLCDKHFDEALSAQIRATFEAWKAQGWDPHRRPAQQPKKAAPEPTPVRQEPKPEKDEGPPKPQGELF
jgi:hypothetical protein